MVWHFLNTDVNECSGNSSRCEHLCTNTYGSYVCSCNPGYGISRNGFSCTGMRDRQIHDIHSITRLKNMALFNVIDIDECALGIDNCAHDCMNSHGSYTCSCRTGYTLDADGFTCNGMYMQLLHSSLKDPLIIDDHYNFSIFGNNRKSLLCTLKTDLIIIMRFDNNALYHCLWRTILLERNECDEISNQCEQNCHNIAGSYNCSCNTGYTLNSDGHACDGRQGLTTPPIVADYNDYMQMSMSVTQLPPMTANTPASILLGLTHVNAILDLG